MSIAREEKGNGRLSLFARGAACHCSLPASCDYQTTGKGEQGTGLTWNCASHPPVAVPVVNMVVLMPLMGSLSLLLVWWVRPELSLEYEQGT